MRPISMRGFRTKFGPVERTFAMLECDYRVYPTFQFYTDKFVLMLKSVYHSIFHHIQNTS